MTEKKKELHNKIGAKFIMWCSRCERVHVIGECPEKKEVSEQQ